MSASAARILVVDDDAASAEVVRLFLGALGYEIEVAGDGEQALERFEATHPALVLLDVMLPGCSGLDVCRLMKQHPTHAGAVRIIMLTALGAWDDRQRALRTGADDYLTKPLDLQLLAATIQRNLVLVCPSP